MFLRGYGSQSFTQENGWMQGVTSTNHKSGELNSIQGDAFRPAFGFLGQLAMTEHLAGFPYSYFDKISIGGFPDELNPEDPVAREYNAELGSPGPCHISFPMIDSSDLLANNEWGATTDDFSNTWASGDLGWGAALTQYKYSLSGNSKDGFSLEEEEIHPQLTFAFTTQDLEIDLGRQMATSNEIRPVNIAVRYFIKAR